MKGGPALYLSTPAACPRQSRIYDGLRGSRITAALKQCFALRLASFGSIEMVQVLAPADAAKFIVGLPAEEAAALLRGLDLEAAQAILLDMSVAERARLLQHWDESFTVEVGFFHHQTR